MSRTRIARANIKGVSAAADSSGTPLAALTRKLEGLSTPPKTTSHFRIRREARIQAVRWLNRLDTTDELDELWPAFEVWLTRRPVNLQQYVAAERTRCALDELSRWCPPEGSEEAEQLLRLVADEAEPRCFRVGLTPRLFLIMSIVVSAVALLLRAR